MPANLSNVCDGQPLGATADPSHISIVYLGMAAIATIHVSIFWRAHVADLFSAVIQLRQRFPTMQTRAKSAIAEALATCRWRNCHDDAMTCKIHERLNRQVAKSVIGVAFPFASLILGIEVIILILVGMGATWRRDLVIDGGILPMHCSCIFVCVFPVSVSGRTLPFWYSSWMILFCCVMAIGFTHERYDASAPIFLVAQMVLSHLLIGMKLKLFWNVTYLCVVCYCYASTPSLCEGRMAPGEFAVREFVTFTAHMLLARSWEGAKIKDCELFHQNHFQTKEHVAFNALLTATYDVVVKLDTNMCINEGADKLASMLLVGNGNQLEMAEFQSLFCQEDDKHRFTSGISRSAIDATGVAHAFHVHMRDGIGNLVAVALFHASVLDLDEQVSHIIGIREESTEMHCSQKVALVLDGTQDRLAPLRGYSCGVQASVDASSDSEVGSHSSCSTAASWVSMAKHEDGNPFLTILADDQLTIVDCNPAFDSLFGHTRPSNLESLIEKVDSVFYTNLDVVCRMTRNEYRASLIVQHSTGSAVVHRTKFVLHSVSKSDELVSFCIELQDVQTCLRKVEQKKCSHSKRSFPSCENDAIATPDVVCEEVSVDFEMFTASIIHSSDGWNRIFGVPSGRAALKDFFGRRVASDLHAQLQATLQRIIYNNGWDPQMRYLNHGCVKCKGCDGSFFSAQLYIAFSDPKAAPNQLLDGFYVVKLSLDSDRNARLGLSPERGNLLMDV